MVSKLNPILLILVIATFLSCGKETKVTNLEIEAYIPNPFNLSELEQELLELIQPISNPTVDISDEDLEAFAYLAEADVVGLGEATHNTKEFFEMKHKIFQYLAENHGFRLFGMEADLGESYYLDKYITTGEGNLDILMRDTMVFWVWRTEEVKNMFEWMRTFNNGRSADDQIRYYGVDCQFADRTSALLRNFLDRSVPELAGEYDGYFTHLDFLNRSNFNFMGDGVIEFIIEENINKLDSLILANESQFVAEIGLADFQFIERLIRQLHQIRRFRYEEPNKQENNRDLYMAENTTSFFNYHNKEKKMSVWAHNGHSNVDPNYHFSASSLGHYLNESGEHKYLNLMFAFSKGSFNAINPDVGFPAVSHEITNEPLAGSLNEIFSNLPDDNFVLNINDITINTLMYDWSKTNIEVLNIGSGFRPSSNETNPSYYYRSIEPFVEADLIMYIHKTTAAEMIQ